MKKVFLSIMCLSLLAACTNQNSTVTENSTDTQELATVASVDTANAPVFKFEKEVYDFGEIKEGEKVTYDFKFKNIGNSPLIISSATATCGCTIPEYPKEPVAPGAEGLIRVVFNSAGKAGMQNKIVSITANTVPSLTELNILGNVLAPN
ncbi:DUF1573 domain-containing protein [Daejeonella sp.]|jgi:hypothetical protein|uniref:DUF1573 domain-containing protein n=1 Tax=Daejeonella sp. TaxID=2805397 RepID=UPI0027B8FBA4|nr:DUF1573 domain-containing protein [Daejeonella sp.]